MTTYNDTIQKVKDLIYGDGSIIASHDIFTRVKKEVKEAQEDPTLSGIGIAQKARGIREKGAVELARIIRANKADIDAELDVAEKSVRAVISSPNPQPSAEQLREFTDKYGSLKTELLVFNNKRAAQQLLEFMEDIRDPYIAKIIVDDFANTGVELNKHITDPLRLRTSYEQIKATAETDAKTQARQNLDEIARLRAAQPVNSMVRLGAAPTLGEELTDKVLRDYESFLQVHGE
ncbi:hypothetical protein ACU1JV_03355 [Paenibacillus sp. T2-29]|uniref:hypothetical protein n=1 Tax=Paenibacillus TaxID=44249 RepID=UPI0039BCC494